jgi:hypothetical protein
MTVRGSPQTCTNGYRRKNLKSLFGRTALKWRVVSAGGSRSRKLDQVRFLVIVMTPAAKQSEMTRKESRYARQRGVNVYPVKGCPDTELDYASLPNWMRKAHFFDVAKEWEPFVNYLKSDREPKRAAFMAPDFPKVLSNP